MKATLTLSLLILLAGVFTEACDPPPNFKYMEPKFVLANIDLVILGSFTSQDNLTETTDNNMTAYLVTLNTQVDCILRNKNNLNISRNIKITDFDRGDNWKNINTCTDYLHDIRFNTQVVIGIRTHYNRVSELIFDEHNLQGPYYYFSGSGKIDLKEMMWVCGFQAPVATTGGSCPSILPQDVGCVSSEKAGVGRPTMTTALIISLFSLFLML